MRSLALAFLIASLMLVYCPCPPWETIKGDGSAILEETWQALPERFPNLTLDEFVIMPDHVHFILSLEGNVEKAPTLGAVIGAYKSITNVLWLRHIKTMGSRGLEQFGCIWQPNYYDHIIRDDCELEQKRKYIRDNPIRWKQRHEAMK